MVTAAFEAEGTAYKAKCAEHRMALEGGMGIANAPFVSSAKDVSGTE